MVAMNWRHKLSHLIMLLKFTLRNYNVAAKKRERVKEYKSSEKRKEIQTFLEETITHCLILYFIISFTIIDKVRALFIFG